MCKVLLDGCFGNIFEYVYRDGKFVGSVFVYGEEYDVYSYPEGSKLKIYL